MDVLAATQRSFGSSFTENVALTSSGVAHITAQNIKGGGKVSVS